MRIIVICILVSFNSWAQRQKPENYRRFDEKLLHFGFMLGGNSSDYTVFQELNTFEKYGLKSLTHQSAPGGQLGIVTTMKLGTPIVRLRFIPTLSFQERVLTYNFYVNDTTDFIKSLEKTLKGAPPSSIFSGYLSHKTSPKQIIFLLNFSSRYPT